MDNCTIYATNDDILSNTSKLNLNQRWHFDKYMYIKIEFMFVVVVCLFLHLLDNFFIENVNGKKKETALHIYITCKI